MIKWKITLITITILICLATAANAETCKDQIITGQNCTILTPNIDCSHYNITIWNETGGLVRHVNLTSFASNMYTANFNESTGSYVLELCEGTIREIIVKPEDKMAELIGIAILLFGITLLFGYWATLKDAYMPLKLVFALLTLFMVMVDFYFAMQISAESLGWSTSITHSLTGMYNVGMIIFIFFFLMAGVFVLYFLFTNMSQLADIRWRTKKKREMKMEGGINR